MNAGNIAMPENNQIPFFKSNSENSFQRVAKVCRKLCSSKKEFSANKVFAKNRNIKKFAALRCSENKCMRVAYFILLEEFSSSEN
jgi:hypothetical protein